MCAENFLNSNKPAKLVNTSDTISLKTHTKRFTEKDYQFRKDCLEAILRYTQAQAVDIVYEKGHRNRDGNKHSKANVRKYGLEFVVLYPKDARKVYQAVLGDYPETPDGEASWIFFVITKALQHFKGKEFFIRWALKNGLYKKGFKFFQPHYNLRDEDFYAFDYIYNGMEE